jgi:thiamine pyrophosphate-dependent acetolactate synthase large subunit-like protein
MAKDKDFDRRSLLKGATMLAAAGMTSMAGAPPAQAAAAVPTDAERKPPPRVQSSAGSDFMVDVVRELGFDYIAANPGASFRGFHESILNHAGNRAPEFLTCLHEETAVGMAQGYAKLAGKPLAVAIHGTVGLQHATMALYNAWCDRVPVFVLAGNTVDAARRGQYVHWLHSCQDPGSLVRDFTKWDDQPMSLTAFAESAMRAYKVAVTPPMEPVLLVMDSTLQEAPIEGETPALPRKPVVSSPVGEPEAVKEAARWLAAADQPVIVVDRCARTPAGVARLIELAELLQAPVIDQGGRMNFPVHHPLNLTDRGRALLSKADVILEIEVADRWGVANDFHDEITPYETRRTRTDSRTITITAADLYLKSNYQDFLRYAPADLAIAGDGEATLPGLIDAVRVALPASRQAALTQRGQALADQRREALVAARAAAAVGWNASPISTARLCMELWASLDGQDYTLAADTGNVVSGWPQRLWPMEAFHHCTGGSGGHGIGYNAPAALGSALANKGTDRITVSIQTDGDLLYAPGVLWTAAHHKIPILYVMHNNRAYHQEIMTVQQVANRRERGIDRVHIGTTIVDPPVDFAGLGRSLGVWTEGPITDPSQLGAALRRAIAAVRRGEPALVDVVTQPR